MRDVQSATGELVAISAVPTQTNVETQRGTEHLHGQAFLFNRQNLLGAQNPFTQWVQETAPLHRHTVPVFTPVAYSPGDREALWGAGIGGVMRNPRLFWFAALDGYERNDPAVSTVKHPDNFFAQPSNDQMQLLSAQLGLSSADPVSGGLGAYSKLLESLDWSAWARAAHLFSMDRVSAASIGMRPSGIASRFEATGAQLDSPGGGFTRASETYGTHSFGIDARDRAVGCWAGGRHSSRQICWPLRRVPYGHQVQSALQRRPPPSSKRLNINAWGQLPQIVVDSRYGFTIGNPSALRTGKLSRRASLSWRRSS